MKSKRPFLRVGFWVVYLTLAGLILYSSFKEKRGIWFSAARTVQPKTAYKNYQLGKKLWSQRKFEEAENALQEAIAMDDQLGKAYLQLGVLYLDIYRADLAEDYILKALELVKGKDKANEEIAYFNLGNLYEERKLVKKAWKYFRKAYEMKSSLGDEFWEDDPRRHVYYVMHNDRKGFNASVLKKDEDTLPLAVWKWQERLKILSREKKYNQVIKEGEYYIRKHPGSEYCYVMSKYLVKANFEKRRYDEMFKHLQLLDKADLSSEDSAWKHFLYYYYYATVKDNDLALKHLTIVIDKYNNTEDIQKVYYAKVRLLEEMRDVDTQRRVLHEIIERFPESQSVEYVHYKLHLLELYAGNYDKSYEHLVKLGRGPRYIIGVVVQIVFGSGLVVLFLFLVMCVFFNKKREALKNAPFRLRHYFVFSLITSSCSLFLLWLMLSCNYYLYDFFSHLHLNPLLIVVIISGVLGVWYVLYLSHNVYKVDYKTLGFRFSGFKIDLLAPLLAVGGLMVITKGYRFLLDHFRVMPPRSQLQEITTNITHQGNTLDIVILIAMMTLIIPIIEEIIFRMFMIRYVEKFTSVWFAVIFSSFAFALGHEPLHFFPVIFIMGLVFSALYLKTKSIIPAIVAHAVNNVLATTGYFL